VKARFRQWQLSLFPSGGYQNVLEKVKLNLKKYRRAWRTRMAVTRMLRVHSEIKLEIGAGPVKGKNGWVTLDLSDQSDLFWDLKETLPFPDNCVDMIYSSHVLEHFRYSELIRLLQDCRRILKPGGLFSVCVPDASIYIHGYLNYETFDRWQYLTYRPAVISDARMDILNYMAYMDGHHRYMFDKENLTRVLSHVGFTSVKLRDFDPALDLKERKYESIYALGFKP
jgi:predicted SAM-dependent methyltransferase